MTANGEADAREDEGAVGEENPAVDERASDEEGAGVDGGVSEEVDASALLETDDRNRLRAALTVLPFLGLGLFDLVLLLGWGLDPLWGFLLLPPILFVSGLAWIAFSTGFARDRTDP